MPRYTFPGIGDYLGRTDLDPVLRNEALDDRSLAAACDLIGEASLRPEHAADVLAAARSRAAVVFARAAALASALDDAAAALTPPPPAKRGRP